MAKAKRARGREESRALTKKQITRSKKAARQQRMIWLAVAGVTALVLIVLAIGIVQEYVLVPRRPVATINGEDVSRAEYQRRVRYARWYLQSAEERLVQQQASLDPNDESQQFLYQYIGSQVQQVQQQLYSVPTEALEDLIDEALVRQEADRRGLTVSDAELELSVERQFGYDRNPPEPTPTPITATTVLTPATPVAPMTKEEFDKVYNEFRESLSAVKGLSEEGFRDLVKQGLLREKLSEAMAAAVPTTDEHVHAYHITVEDEEMATEVLEKLRAGESFADLSVQYSKDDDSKEEGGELGWLAIDQAGVLPEVVEAAFALQPGEFSEAIETYLGYHIVTIDERQTDYPLDEATLASRQAQAFSDWLTKARETADIERTWLPEDIPTD